LLTPSSGKLSNRLSYIIPETLFGVRSASSSLPIKF
jgi:hypothetical protein